MPTAKTPISPRVIGHSIEHSACDGSLKRTHLGASMAHSKLRLEITQGSTKVQILASDWEFFKKQADELLGKRRLLESALK